MVYVLDRFGQPLMPCSARTARHLLRLEKARVIHRTPFTLQLRHGASGYRQPVTAALDTGSKVVGCAAIANGLVVYQSEVSLRNDITGKLEQRRAYRRTRRSRNLRYRPARFSNRCASTRKGRLAPSLQSKIDSHLREVRFVDSILPVSQWNFELASFDIHKITNPEVTGEGYQNGSIKGFYNNKHYVLHRDGYQCQSGQKIQHNKKLHVHHKQFRSNGGADTPENLVTFCETCHGDYHAGKFTFKEKGRRSKTKHATEMGIIKSRLSQCAVAHRATFGYETKYKREQHLKWPKTHANDAVAACLEDGEIVLPMEKILIKNHMAKGDYKQTAGQHSQLTVPTGKLFGLRKGDKVVTSRGIGFIKGKRSTGYFSIQDLDGNVIHSSEKVASCTRITGRTTTQVEEIQLIALTARRKEKELRMQAEKTAKEEAKAAIAAQSAPVLAALNDGVSRSNI